MPGLLRKGAGARRTRRGLTFVELCIVMGIASTLFAMAHLLAQHVNAITKIRRAQAELAQWQAAIDDWFVQFGEYPCFDMRLSPERNDTSRICDKAGLPSTAYNLGNVASNACIRLYNEDGTILDEKFFSQYIVGAPSLKDPWGRFYIYIPADEDPDDTLSHERIIYTLFSCGPDGKSPLTGDNPKTEQDDVYFGQ